MIKVIAIAKTSEKYLQTGINEYLNRLKHFHKVELIEIPALKNTRNLSEDEQKRKEGEQILGQLKPDDYLILLDENGKQFSSEKMAEILEKRLSSYRSVVFVIGGPYGFAKEIYDRSSEKWALSELTFSHQMVRLFFLEQLYRSFAILKNLPYHHR
jgi:23S rRNA (pseudouridine1915-N3)-methyltransferase